LDLAYDRHLPVACRHQRGHFSMHEPLSQRLAHILAAGDGLTLNQLIDRTDGRGIFSILILLALPFVGPVSLAGISVPFGLAIAWLALRLARGLPPRLPKRLGDRPLPPGLRKVVQASVKLLRGLERVVKPRPAAWMDWPPVRTGNALLIMMMAVLLALPLPPVPPFTNALPSYTIILLAASLMEQDGRMIWAGYAAALGTVLYLGFWAGLIATHLAGWWHRLLQLVQSGP